MTVSNTASSITISGNGVQTVFAYSFEIPYQDDGVTIAASVYTTTAGINTSLNPTQYSLTGVGVATGGTVMYTGGGTPLPVGSSITISRAKSLTQPYAFPNNSFLPSTVEAALDNVVLEMQQLIALVSTGPATMLVTGNTTLGINARTVVAVSPAAAVTITLPAATTALGMYATIKDANGTSDTNAITIVATGGGNLDGYASFILSGRYQSVTFFSDGVQWLSV